MFYITELLMQGPVVLEENI